MTHQRPFGLEQGLDAALHLLDRQVVDSDGRLACKVDDVELTERDGTLFVTGLLVGPSALLPRIGGGALARLWALTSVARAGREVPGWVDVAGPALLGAALRWVHRHSVLVALDESRIDRVTGTVHVRRPAGPLRGLREVGQDGSHDRGQDRGQG